MGLVTLIALRSSALGRRGAIDHYIMLPELSPRTRDEAVARLAALGRPARCVAAQNRGTLWVSCWPKFELGSSESLAGFRAKSAWLVLEGIRRHGSSQPDEHIRILVRDSSDEVTIDEGQFEEWAQNFDLPGTAWDVAWPDAALTKFGINAVLTFHESGGGQVTGRSNS
jgi:hypothetical protein